MYISDFCGSRIEPTAFNATSCKVYTKPALSIVNTEGEMGESGFSGKARGSIKDRQAISLLLGAGNLHHDVVFLPLPFHISPDSTDWITAQQWEKAEVCGEKG